MNRKTTGTAAAAAGVIILGGGMAAGIAVAAVAAPAQPSQAGGVYSSIVHECVNLANSHQMYVEENTDPGQVANCANGYEQFTVNSPFLNPAGITLNLGGTSWTCKPGFESPSSQTQAGNPVEIDSLACTAAAS